MEDQVKLRKEKVVYYLSFNRPEKRNAFGAETIDQFLQALRQVGKDEEARVLVIEGAGAVFSAGADLNWMKSMVNFSLKQNMEDAEALHAMLQSLYEFPKPTIAKVHGAAFGGAVGVLAACDVAVVETNTKLALSETRLGIIPAVISPFLLRKIGVGHLRAYGLSAKVFNAEEALQIGLAHEVAESDSMAQVVQKWIDCFLHTGPHAIANLKKLTREIEQISTREARTFTAQAIAEARTSPEGQEGMKAFLEKRKPDWMAGES